MKSKMLQSAAYAHVGDLEDASTWLLRHHYSDLHVNWREVSICVESLSPTGYFRTHLPPESVLAAAAHLAAHYRFAKRPLPNALAVLV